MTNQLLIRKIEIWVALVCLSAATGSLCRISYHMAKIYEALKR